MAAIIFDMDGTIADSFDYVADFLAQEAGYRHLSDQQRRQLRGLSMIAMARQLGYHWWQAPWLLFKGRRRMHKIIRRLNAFNGMPELIRKLHAEGHELFILSTNSVRNIHHFLHQQKLHTYFLEIYGGVGMLGKAAALRQLLQDQQIDKQRAVYVGDELRDVKAAKAIDLRIVAVSWGFAGREELALAQPTQLVDTPAELLSVLEEL